MKHTGCDGVTLIELLIAMAVASILGTMILQLVIGFQSCLLTEIRRNDLQARAERLIHFMANDLREAAFMIGALPEPADGSPLILSHNSLPGSPAEELPASLIVVDHPGGDDRLTILKAVSFDPSLRLAQPAPLGGLDFVLNRRPNRSPGSTRELHPTPDALNHLVFANHRVCYPIRQADLIVELVHPLQRDIPANTEVLGLRVCHYQLGPSSGSRRLYRDDFTSRDILDDAVDGLQFEYLLKDGTMVNQVTEMRAVRGIRISLLVRALDPDPGYTDTRIYTLANRTFGPFHDHFRRHLVSQLVEIKNHAL